MPILRLDVSPHTKEGSALGIRNVGKGLALNITVFLPNKDKLFFPQRETRGYEIREIKNNQFGDIKNKIGTFEDSIEVTASYYDQLGRKYQTKVPIRYVTNLSSSTDQYESSHNQYFLPR